MSYAGMFTYPDLPPLVGPVFDVFFVVGALLHLIAHHMGLSEHRPKLLLCNPLDVH